MKKFAISLIALAAISTAALASQRSYDLRDSDTYFGTYATQPKTAATKANALAVVKETGALTNFELMKKLSEENDQGRH